MKKNTEILKCIFNSLKTMVFDAISFNSKFTPKTSAYSKFTPKTSAFTFLVIDISFINHGLSWKALDIWLKTDIEWVILFYFRTYFASVYKIEGKGPFVFIYLFFFNLKTLSATIFICIQNLKSKMCVHLPMWPAGGMAFLLSLCLWYRSKGIIVCD